MSDEIPQERELVLYRTSEDSVRVEVLYESETLCDFEPEVKRMDSKRPRKRNEEP